MVWWGLWIELAVAQITYYYNDQTPVLTLSQTAVKLLKSLQLTCFPIPAKMNTSPTFTDAKFDVESKFRYLRVPFVVLVVIFTKKAIKHHGNPPTTHGTATIMEPPERQQQTSTASYQYCFGVASRGTK